MYLVVRQDTGLTKKQDTCPTCLNFLETKKQDMCLTYDREKQNPAFGFISILRYEPPKSIT
jgi:hypothetical protein